MTILLRRLGALALLVVPLLVLTTPPAEAKGPTDVTVSGWGVDVTLGYTRRGDDVDIGTLGGATRMYDAMGRLHLRPAPPVSTDDLGPRYVITWLMEDFVVLEQHAYPFAPGGAWVYFVPNESGWSSGEPGWAPAPGLTAQLTELGAVEHSLAPVLGRLLELVPWLRVWF